MKAQWVVCNKLKLKPTNCIIFAQSNPYGAQKFNRGNDLTRLCIQSY